MDDDKKDDFFFEYYGRFRRPYKQPNTLSQTLGQKVNLSPQARNRALSNFVEEHGTPSIDNIIHYHDSKHPYYQLCFLFLQERYMDIEEYSLAPFIEFYKKVFANETLKKSFIQHILYYLKNAKIDLNQPALPSKNQTKTLFSSIKTEKFLEYTREKGEIWLERMLAYQFIKYLQKNPDFFRQIVARHNKQ